MGGQEALKVKKMNYLDYNHVNNTITKKKELIQKISEHNNKLF